MTFCLLADPLELGVCSCLKVLKNSYVWSLHKKVYAVCIYYESFTKELTLETMEAMRFSFYFKCACKRKS